MTIKLMASVLTADQSILREECQRLEDAGLDGIQWDLMDGVAVPSLSFGPDVIAACRPHVSFDFEAHVMVRDPSRRLLEELAAAGCQRTLVHPEMLTAPWRTLETIRGLGMRGGVALSPGIPVELGSWLYDLVDQVLVMTVEPGYGGQAYLPQMEAKVAAVEASLHACAGPIGIEVDGGIAPDTIAGSYAAGARVFVVGSALWRGESTSTVVERLRARCAQVRESGTVGNRRIGVHGTRMT